MIVNTKSNLENATSIRLALSSFKELTLVSDNPVWVRRDRDTVWNCTRSSRRVTLTGMTNQIFPTSFRTALGNSQVITD